MNYLLFDSECAKCGNLARTVEQVAGGWLESRSLHDPSVQELLSEAKPGWTWRPMLVTFRNGRARVYSGTLMVVRMGVALGPVKSFRILTGAA
ncbi:hypothetical protein [Nocardiopsis halophila]|uniref:hypothetical protein n=1 Tax=Nocardiopsis halophila TaxID=141692 RepID=UPI000348495D|nr:hypothetical protein [Nocardiopsis halophila]